jgi:hypothetical protein
MGYNGSATTVAKAIDNRNGGVDSRYGCSFLDVSSTFASRLEELIAAAGSASKLALAAGLSAGYLGTLKTRMRVNPDARPDESAMEALARAGGVSYEWLRKGTGERASQAHEVHAGPTDTEPFADAIAAAFDGRRHSLADLDAARRVARETHTHLRDGADTEAIAATWLNAAAALRRAGREATPSAILMHLSELATGAAAEREQTANADADASLRAKGIEPGEPVASLESLKKRAAIQK